MKMTGYFALVLLVFGQTAFAVDSGAVIGGAIGGATGAAVGDAIGGRNGAILGAAVGGATGAAVGSKESKQVKTAPVQVQTVQTVSGDEERDRHEHHDNGRHLGERKHKNKHEHED